MEIETDKKELFTWDQIASLQAALQAKKKDGHKISAIALNRRYKKLQQLIDEDDFFSEDQIKLREPLLFYLYCGQFAKKYPEKPSGSSFSDFLGEVMMKEEFRIQLEQAYKANKSEFPEKLVYDQSVSEEEISENEDDLIRFMHTKFLIGEESKHFNYEEIDNDINLDDRKIREQDDEDRYFDDEEESNPSKNTDTGIEDY